MASDYAEADSSRIMRLKPTASLNFQYAPSYSSVASDEIELVNNHETPIRYPPKRKRLGNGLFQFGNKNRAPKKTEKSWSLLRRRLVTRVLPLFVLLGLLVLLIMMSVVPFAFTQDTGGVCKPDGTFELSFDAYTPWKRDGIFAINIKFGRLSFGLAKLIDVSWDIVIGRGGQAFLAIFTYIVFTKGLTRTMETSSVPHDTFKAITLQNDTFWGVLMLLKNFSRLPGRRAKGMMAWIILSACFVLLIPTWLSAMTGYVANIETFVGSGGTNFPISNFRPVIYTIHDGARLQNNFQNDTRVVIPWSVLIKLDSDNAYGCAASYGSVTFTNDTTSGVISDTNSTIVAFDSDVNQECKLLWSVSRYVYEYGFFALSDSPNTTFYLPDESNITTPVYFSPPLNVSAHFALPADFNVSHSSYSYEWNYYPYGKDWKYPNTDNYAFFPQNPIFLQTGTTKVYNLTEFNTNGACQQAAGEVKYQWGFSYLLLYVFVLSLIIWIVGMWIFYLDCLFHSRLSKREMGYERAVLDLSQSMQGRIEVKDVSLRGNHEVRNLVKENVITYSDLPFDLAEPTRWTKFRRDHSFKRWIKDEIWWLSAFILFTVLIPLSWLTPVLYGWFPYASPIPTFGIILVLIVGRETYGRWTIFAFWFAVFVAVDIWWIVQVTAR